MLRARDFRRIVLAMSGVLEGEHMAHPDFRVNGRIFATLHPDNLSGMVKLTPDQQRIFVQENPAAFTPENGAWGRQGCTRVVLDSVDEDKLGEVVTLAWENIVNKGKAASPARKRAARPIRSPRRPESH